MIVAHHMPTLIVMTIAALHAEAGGVCIVGFVAAVAILRDFLLVIAAAMTRNAVDPLMHAQQFVARLLQMVVLRRLPFLRNVALRAVLTA